MVSYKQVIVLRDDLNMSKGKMISQACHASLNAYKKASSQKISEWKSQGSKKIALTHDDLQELLENAQRLELPTYLVSDAGMTELEPGTRTALAIGPDEESKIDQITGELELIN